MTPDQWATFGSGGVVIVGGVVAWVRYIGPRWRHLRDRLDAGLESVAGRPAVIDRASGRQIDPAVPGIGVRMANLEDSVALLVERERRFDEQDKRMDRLDSRVTKLETAAVERIVTRADSALAWRAIRAVADNGGPDNVGGDHLDDMPDDYLDGTSEGLPGDSPRT